MPIISIEDAVAESDFDIIIVGGGTSGLLVAVRIAESKRNFNVLVLEAGISHENDPLVDVPGLMSRTLGNPLYDWVHMSEPQTRLNDRVMPLDHGKGLGGSSAINFTGLFRPTMNELDAFEKLGNPGWNAASLDRCLQKSLIAASQPQYIPATHEPIVEGLESLGIPRTGERGIGVSTCTLSVDPETAKRSYSASGYYYPKRAELGNLFVALNVTVTRINLEPTDDELVRATGVQVHGTGSTDTTHILQANKEIILSAGAIHTPHILEHSGIGDRNILSKFGIKCLVDLPGVGENLQDHGLVPTVAEVDSTIETAEMLADPAILEKHQELHKQRSGFLAGGITTLVAFIPASKLDSGSKFDWEKSATIESLDVGSDDIHPNVKKGIVKQYSILRGWLTDPNATEPFAQILHLNAHFPTPGISKPLPGKRYITLSPVYSHPFSRGYVHLMSPDPKIPPAVNPRYFSHPNDKQILEAGLRFTLGIYDTPSVNPFIIGIRAGKQEQEAYIKEQLTTVWHQSGTAVMLPREYGGVVDERLRVYGTKGLRVVDASIIPLLPSVNTQSVVYMLAEKALALLLNNQNSKLIWFLRQRRLCYKNIEGTEIAESRQYVLVYFNCDILPNVQHRKTEAPVLLPKNPYYMPFGAKRDLAMNCRIPKHFLNDILLVPFLRPIHIDHP
ncbi:choline dehydrogenase [Moniliophthora roreri MCA 2997]|uniref:Choline dehydrogenase n=1 Tax=Moniliophthora roreri (strain MCA 2997) TaxID=1381753 RepID=V2W8K3_MONRO|nr:choline dehydrogenase [Moniliophthora roreri MCA 2997]